MRKTILLLITIAALAGAAPSQAAPINNCGHLPDLFNGYQEVANVTSRHVPCQQARHAARGLAWTMIGKGFDGWPKPSYFTFHWRGWTARGHWTVRVIGGTGFWTADVRSTASGGRVARFQFGGE